MANGIQLSNMGLLANNMASGSRIGGSGPKSNDFGSWNFKSDEDKARDKASSDLATAQADLTKQKLSDETEFRDWSKKNPYVDPSQRKASWDKFTPEQQDTYLAGLTGENRNRAIQFHNSQIQDPADATKLASAQMGLENVKAANQEKKNVDWTMRQKQGGFSQYQTQDSQDWIGKPWQELSPEQRTLAAGYGSRMGISPDQVPSGYETWRQGFNPTAQEKERESLAKMPAAMDADKMAMIGTLRSQGKTPQEVQALVGGALSQIESVPFSAPDAQQSQALSASGRGQTGSQPVKLLQDNTPVSNKINQGAEIFSTMFSQPYPDQEQPVAQTSNESQQSLPPETLLNYQNVLSQKQYQSVEDFARGEGFTLDQAKAIARGIKDMRKSP